MKWLLYIIAPFFLLAGIGLAFLFTTDSGKPSPAWIQAGAAASLLAVTIAYAKSAHDALSESKDARKLAQKSLKEAETSRMNSLRPVVAIRYFWKDLDSDGKQTMASSRSTYLLNVGSGPATNLKVWSNFETVYVETNRPARSIRSSDLKIWSAQDYAFGIPLGPDTGNLDTQIAFMNYYYKGGYYTPIEDPEKAVLFFIEYLDVFDRIFVTMLIDGVQIIYGPLSKRGRNRLFSKIEKLASERAWDPRS